MMSPLLREIADRNSERLITDPVFSAKVKSVYQVMRTLAPERDWGSLATAAYLLTCILEGE